MESRDASDARHDEHADEPVEQTDQTGGKEREDSPEAAAEQQGGAPEKGGDEPSGGERPEARGEAERAETEGQAEDKARESINKAFE